jgi:HSP20 family protein
MSIVRWKPMLAPDFRSLVNDFFGDKEWFGTDGNTLMPAVNVRELKDMYLIELAAPGLNKNDFNIEVENGVLMISAEHKDEKEEKDDKYTRKEFSYNKFMRSFTLPENVKADAIKALYEDGLLKVEVPLLETKVMKTKKVEIK